MIVFDDAGLSPAEVVERTLNRIVGAAMVDAGLRHRLLADPVAALAEAGFPVAEGVAVSVVEVALKDAASAFAGSTGQRLVLPLPPMASGVLTDDQLDAVAGGQAVLALPFGSLNCVLDQFSGAIARGTGGEDPSSA